MPVLRTDQALRHIADYSEGRLRSLEFPRNDNFTSDGFAYLLERMPLLETLVVASCAGFTDVALSALAHCCPLVRELNISRCIFITDSSLRQAITLLRQLRVLKAYGVHHAMMGSMVVGSGPSHRAQRRRGGVGIHAPRQTTSILYALRRRGVQVHYRKHTGAGEGELDCNDDDDVNGVNMEGYNADGTVCAALSNPEENQEFDVDCRCREIVCTTCSLLVRSCRVRDHQQVRAFFFRRNRTC